MTIPIQMSLQPPAGRQDVADRSENLTDRLVAPSADGLSDVAAASAILTSLARLLVDRAAKPDPNSIGVPQL